MVDFLRRRLSYANVTATLALLFAMSGGALAARHYLINSTRQINPKVLKTLHGKQGLRGYSGSIGKTGPEGGAGPEGKRGQQGPSGAAASTLTAAIAADGSITRQNGVTEASQPAGEPGHYTLTWKPNVDQCYPVATVSGEEGSVTIKPFEANDPKSLRLITRNSAGMPTNEAFYVVIVC